MSSRLGHLTYEQSLEILGSPDSRIARSINFATKSLDIALGHASFGVLELLGVQGPLVDWATQLLRSLADRVARLNRKDRSECLYAAHGVLVMLAFQESCRTIYSDGSLTLEEMKNDQALYGVLTLTPVPVPSPSSPPEIIVHSLRQFYTLCTDALLKVGEPSEAESGPRLEIPSLAVERYEELTRKLMLEVPEYGLWSSTMDHIATRDLVRTVLAQQDRMDEEVGLGMRRVEQLLRSMPVSAKECLDELNAVNAAVFRRSVLQHSASGSGTALPTVEDIYVPPKCTVEAWESFSGRQNSVIDIELLLSSLLTFPDVLHKVITVWGLPGSGKSTLVQVLAARLPADQFKCLIVNLRDVPSDATVHQQVDGATKAILGGNADWIEIARRSPDLLPVLVFDGVDEMLLASGRDRAGYLEELRDFQRLQADAGRDTIVFATARTAVRHRLRRLRDHEISLSLLPFDPGQITEWCRLWNDFQRLRSVGRHMLPTDTVLRHLELAEQPILLLLLALYDLRTSALSQLDSKASAAELYESVLRDYARREVERRDRNQSEADFLRATGALMRAWAMIALVFINRRTSVLSLDVIARDLQDLQVVESGHSGEDLVSHFYFIYENRTIAGANQSVRSVEFLQRLVY